ncbi:MAG: hypothetical protein JST04_07365 [Bdellovibrionales bacterium]|nr:hypothetical protein [Bdellovibrionales bacterium]
MASAPSSASRNRGALAFDFWLSLGLVALVSGALSRSVRWSPLLHLGLPLVLLPFLRYAFYRFTGTTPGQFLTGLEFRLPGGGRATRLYDWLFNIQSQLADERAAPIPMVATLIAGLMFTGGATVFLWMRDPTLRPLRTEVVPLFAPDSANARDWQILPFFYATGAFPVRLFAHGQPTAEEKGELSVEFGLPYEKGPPIRFIKKMTAYWRDLDSRLTLTGPLSAASPATPEALHECFAGWFRCAGDRRKIWENQIAPQITGRALVENYWFTTDNPFLAADERPQGIYFKTSVDRGFVREAYVLVGPRMAIQSFVLDRPDRPEGVAASETLRKVVGSLRMSGDLQAPRAFVNPKLAALRIGPKSTLADLVAAEGYLLAKVSIEPKEAESFYHLGGLALTLFHAAKREGRIELAASSKTIVKSAVRFARDVDPNSKRLPEMERFEVEVEAP